MADTRSSTSTDHSPTELADAVRAELSMILEHFNTDHADTVLFLAHHAAGRPEATEAEAVDVDALGIDLEVVTAGRRQLARLDFEQPTGTASDVNAQLLGRLAATRTAVGDSVPLTSPERELESVATIRTHVSEVIEVRDLSPNLRQVVLAGGLERFQTLGGDQFAYVMVRRPGGHPVPAGHTIDAQSAGDPDTRPIGAYYTVRSWDQTSGRLTLWMVRHGHDGTVGGWAGRCEIGERVPLWGPRPGFGSRPDARDRLLVADESGLAAVAVLLEELPAAATATVIVETVSVDHVVELPQRSGVRITWLFRGTDEPGNGSRLADAVRRLVLDPKGVVAFGAGESRQMTEIRRYLRHDVGVPAADVSVTGYWRRR